MRRVLFYLNLVVFLFVWLAINAFTLVSLVNTSLPYSLGYFIAFLLILDGLSLPLLWFWYTSSKDPICFRSCPSVAYSLISEQVDVSDVIIW